MSLDLLLWPVVCQGCERSVQPLKGNALARTSDTIRITQHWNYPH